LIYNNRDLSIQSKNENIKSNNSITSNKKKDNSKNVTTIDNTETNTTTTISNSSEGNSNSNNENKNEENKSMFNIKPADENAQDALNLMNTGNYTDAVDQWKISIKQNPNDADSHAMLAACYGSIIDKISNFIDKGNYSGMMDNEINNALAIDSNNVIAHMIRGRKYLSSPKFFGQDIPKAIDDFKFCINNGMSNAEIYYYLGSAYLNNNDNEDAKVNFKKALEIDPGYSDASEQLKKMN
jgi:tetratricopeptide (TPR) repeat protein